MAALYAGFARGESVSKFTRDVWMHMSFSKQCQRNDLAAWMADQLRYSSHRPGSRRRAAVKGAVAISEAAYSVVAPLGRDEELGPATLTLGKAAGIRTEMRGAY
jgi:hypothetical protein